MITKCNWGETAQCYVDLHDRECFMVGKIIWSDNQWFLLQCISPTAHWDGFALISQAELHRLEINSDYCRHLADVLAMRHEAEILPPIIKANPLYEMLDYAVDKKIPIALELCRSATNDVIGRIVSYDQNVVHVQQFDDDGKPNGESWIDPKK